MAKNDNITDLLTDIASAIREKKGTTDLINPQNFSAEIKSIESGLDIADATEDREGKGSQALNNIRISEGVTITAYGAYKYSGVRSVILPTTLETINDHTFYGCGKLSSIIIPRNVRTIRPSAFYTCRFSSITFESDSSLNTIMTSAFESCGLVGDILLPPSVATIDKQAFAYCNNITSISFENHISIPVLTGTNTFKSSSEYKLVVPDSLYEQWVVATNWIEYESRIVKKSEYVES